MGRDEMNQILRQLTQETAGTAKLHVTITETLSGIAHSAGLLRSSQCYVEEPSLLL